MNALDFSIYKSCERISRLSISDFYAVNGIKNYKQLEILSFINYLSSIKRRVYLIDIRLILKLKGRVYDFAYDKEIKYLITNELLHGKITNQRTTKRQFVHLTSKGKQTLDNYIIFLMKADREFFYGFNKARIKKK